MGCPAKTAIKFDSAEVEGVCAVCGIILGRSQQF